MVSTTALRSIGWGMRVLYQARSRHVDFELAPLAARRVTTPTAVRGLDIQVGSAVLRIPKTDFTANQLGLFMGVDSGPARESDVTLVGLDARSHRLCTALQLIPMWMLVNLAR